MASHVRVVAILMIVQGGLECLAGLLYAAMGPLMWTMMKSAMQQQPSTGPHGPSPEQFATYMGVFYVLAGLFTLAVGTFRIVAGAFNLKFKGRMLGIVSLVVGLGSVVTCYCLPTSVALLAYGLIVYLNDEVQQAFAAVERGAPPEFS
jgi:hypothetical protein